MVADRGFKNKTRYLIAFVLATFIFVLIFSLSYYLSYLEMRKITINQDQMIYDLFKDKLNYEFFGQDFCKTDSISKLSEDLSFQRSIIYNLEEKLGKTNEDVLFRKKIYTLIQLEHLSYLKEYNSKCNQTKDYVLFFYSNNKTDVKESERWGQLLDSFYYKHTNVSIYSFDINLDDELIDNLRQKYNITRSQTIIINDNYTIYNLNTLKDIENYFTK